VTDALAAARTRVTAGSVVWFAACAIVVVAVVLRLANLPTRGTWDADQGHDMLVLRSLVQDGRIPLLGPPTSIGDFHHGMLYYLLLAPAAALSGADPTAVTFWIAIGGIVAVVVTGWLGAAIGGRLAGLVAALLMAVSASAVEESTFIWNPNLIALSSSIALAAAWHAWQRRRPRWWIVAGAGCVVTMQCHVLGVILTPVVAALLVADVRRRRGAGDAAGARAVVVSAGWWIVLAALSYVPLAIHELTNDWSELRAAVAFVTGGGGSAAVALPLRLPIVGIRVLGWPLTGLLTAAPIATLLAAGLVVVLTVWRGWFARAGAGSAVAEAAEAADERTGVRWLGLGLLWTVVALAVGAASLATVVIGLPNDHYHAFADPMVFVLVGVGVAALARVRPSWAPAAGRSPRR
jgi:4-amino-4-deoxy-L-arabinose transferase-like glycosyltransferase